MKYSTGNLLEVNSQTKHTLRKFGKDTNADCKIHVIDLTGCLLLTYQPNTNPPPSSGPGTDGENTGKV